MSDRFDEIRSENPDLAINLYAMTPGGDVTLEVITPDGQNFTWTAPTAMGAMAIAFPADPEPDADEPPAPPSSNPSSNPIRNRQASSTDQPCEN